MRTSLSRRAATRAGRIVLPLALLVIAAIPARGQDRLRSMPGYEQFARMSPQIQGSVRLGRLQVAWVDSGKAFDYAIEGKRYRYSVATRKATELTAAADAGAPGGLGRGGRGAGGGPARGRQFDRADSPDGKLRATYRDRNVWIATPDGSNAVAITTDGSEKDRIKNGVASWVYGEELGQNTALWWSPSGSKLAYYRFDESRVPDYYLQMNQTKLQSTLDIEAYPKAGVPNPFVEVFVYDVATRQTVKVDVRDGKPFTDDVVGHYVYNVGWTPDGRELTFNRTNRRQNILEFTACNPDTGSCRVIVRDEWPASWVDNTPLIRFLADGKRFIWESERNGFKNYYLYDLTGALLATLTGNAFEAAGIVRVDEKAKAVWYLARDGDNFLKVQLHRVGLDGRNDRRITDPAFNHSVTLSPDGKSIIDVAETHDQPPATRLLDAQGKVLAELSRSDMTKFDSLGIKRVELFTYKAADGVTTLRGMISFPSNFDPARRYPVLVPVYGGPASSSNTSKESFTLPNALTEYGFLVVNLDSRAVPGMGKRTLDAIYLKLGQVELDDMVAGIKSLWSRPYFDKARVGIYGTSYGGYASALALVRYPDVFAAASASSPVTDWRNYDTIYTERYMYTPQENAAGYDAGSAMTYAANLKGRLLLYYGTADNNVHPNNSMQLIQALQRAQKGFDLQVGPDLGHSGVNSQRMMEFFIDNLVVRPSIGIVP